MDRMYFEANAKAEEHWYVMKQKALTEGLETEPARFEPLQWRFRPLEKWAPRPVPSKVMDMVIALSERLPGYGFFVYDFGEDPLISLVEPLKPGESVQKEHFFAHWDEVEFGLTEQADPSYSS